MSELPEISVVMSVYNGARYLEASINSILTQTFSQFEFIICDDGSTDDTPIILKEIDDPRIIIIENEKNSGLSRSLNRCISVSKSTVIARQDADDLSAVNRLQVQYEYLEKHPRVGVLACATQWIDEQSTFVKIWPTGYENPTIQELLLDTCPIIHGSVIVRKTNINQAGGYNEEIITGQDYDLWLRVSETADIVCLPDVLYTYRQHSQMVSERRRDEQSFFAQKSLELAIERRLHNTYSYLGFSRNSLPPAWTSLERHELSRRLIWWSAGARNIRRSLALQFLLLALAADPFSLETREYIAGIWKRKLFPGYQNSTS